MFNNHIRLYVLLICVGLLMTSSYVSAGKKAPKPKKKKKSTWDNAYFPEEDDQGEEKKWDEDECQVCTSIMQQIYDRLDEGSMKKSATNAELGLIEFCAREDIKPEEKRMCYYLKPIKRTMAQVFGNGVPRTQICQRLKRDNPEVCSIKYPIKVSKDTNFHKMSIRELKKVLASKDSECVGCWEKIDFINKIKDILEAEENNNNNNEL